LTFLALVILIPNFSFGHGDTFSRSWCGGIFNRRYGATAYTQILTFVTYVTGYDEWGRYVGVGAKYGQWTRLCNDEDKGCTRPRHASCSNSGLGHDDLYNGGLFPGVIFPYYAWAYGTKGFGTPDANQDFTIGRAFAGGLKDAWFDPEKLSQLSDSGFAFADVFADVSMSRK